MTQDLKSVIMKRHKAYHKNGGKSVDYRYYTNIVNREGKAWKASFYQCEVDHFKEEKSSFCRTEVKRFSETYSNAGQRNAS